MGSLPSILVVDDEPNSLFGICQVLTDEGFEAISARNGREALERLKTDPVNLIITDEKMPDLTGTELLLEVKKIHPHIPVILISAYGSVLMAVEALRKGAFYFFEKPIFDKLERFLSSSGKPSRHRRWKKKSTLSERRSPKNTLFPIS